MDTWTTSPERCPFGERASPSPAHVLAQVRRLEELTNRKFHHLPQEDTTMPSPKHIDRAAILADHAAGLDPAALATKYQVHRSTIRWHLRSNGHAAETPCKDNVLTTSKQGQPSLESNPPRSSPTNGHAITFDGPELEQLLAEHWNRLPILERVRILLGRS